MDRVEVGPEPDLSVAVFRATPKRGEPDEYNGRVLNRILEDGRIAVSPTMLRGSRYLRLAVLSPRTHRDSIDRAVEIGEIRVGDELLAVLRSAEQRGRHLGVRAAGGDEALVEREAGGIGEASEEVEVEEMDEAALEDLNQYRMTLTNTVKGMAIEDTIRRSV